MLALTDQQKAFLLNGTERFVVLQLDIIDRSTNTLVRRIQHTADDALDGEKLSIIGGQVQVSAQNEITRTLSIDLADPLHEVSVGVTGLIGADKLFAVYKGYKIPAPWGSGEYVTWPLGVFALSGKPSIDADKGQRVIRFQGTDKFSLGNGKPRGGFKQAVTISQGMGKIAAIQQLAQLETWGETQFAFDQSISTATVPYDYPFQASDNPVDAARRIAEIPEPDGRITRLLYDAWGRLTLRVDVGPNMDQLPAVWTVQPTTDGPSQLVSVRKEPDLLGLANAVPVAWGSSTITPGRYTAYDNDPNSPTYVGRIGWFIRPWKGGQQDELIRNLGEATARANYELKRDLSYQEAVPMRIVENPALEPLDVVQVAEPVADINGKYQLLGFTITLDERIEMTADAWKVRSLGT